MRRFVPLLSLASLSFPVIAQGPELTVIGAWTVNRDLTIMPLNREDRPPADGGRREGSGGRGGAPGGRGGGFGGRGGLGGFGGGNGPNEDEVHKAQVIRRRLTEVPLQLIITRHGDSVSIVDEIGRTMTLKADGKKQERVTGDGEFTSKTRFDGAKLVIEDDFGGPKLTTTYTPILEGGEILRLQVTLKPDHLPGAGRERLANRGGKGGPSAVTRVYNADAR